MSEEVITYEPDNFLKCGYVSLLRDIAGEISRNKWLTYQLFRRDFLALYRQSAIGVLWAFFIPLLSVGTFVMLNESGVFSVGDISFPYPIYAILGLALWQIFATGIIACSHSLVNAGVMIKKINFSKKSLVIASMGQSIVPFVVQLVIVCGLFVYYGEYPSLIVLLIPVIALPIALFTLGIGFILALLNGIARDIGNIVTIATTFLMFLTPVLYMKPTTGALSVLADYNPLYYLIACTRDWMLTGSLSEWVGVITAWILAGIVFAVCLIVFHITEVRVAERI